LTLKMRKEFKEIPMKIVRLAAMLCLGLSLAAGHARAQDIEVFDPIEPFNRGVFFFNEVVSHLVMTPLATGYRAITPETTRGLLKNAANNTIEPVAMVNSFLQGDFEQGVVSFWRFVLNTTVGMGGLNDVATTAGLERRYEDFGQTLGVWGMGDGAYLVLPFIGPSNTRDVWRWPAGYYLDPVTTFVDDSATVWAYIGALALIEYESLMDPVADIRASSLDPYVTIRSVYTQRRRALILNQYDKNEGE